MYAGQGGRGSARSASCSSEPLHPYTQGLLRSIPRLDLARPTERRCASRSIPGTVPDAARDIAAGLPLRPALPASLKCRLHRAGPPVLEDVKPGHRGRLLAVDAICFGGDAMAGRRRCSRSRTSRSTSPSAAGCSRREVGARPRGGRRVASTSGGARRWGWWASPAAARPRSGRCILRLIEPTAGEVLLRRRERAPACDGRALRRAPPATCRSSSRTRTPR